MGLIESIREIFGGEFLLRHSFYVSLLIGFGCPLLGNFLVLRRMVFMGVALPAISSTGVALALSLHVWFGHYEGGHGTEEQEYAFLGSFLFSLAAILWLALNEKRGRGPVEGRIGALYVIASSASLLLLAKCPAAERGWLHLFKGEIIGVTREDLMATLLVLALVVGILGLFRKEFLLVSFDPETALVLGKNVLGWNTLVYLLIGTAIAVVVISAGPLMAFGFMVLPPLIAQNWAHNMRQFFWVSSFLGGMGAFVGFICSYHWNLPVGPTDIAVLGVVYFLVLAWTKWVRPRLRSRPAPLPVSQSPG